MTRSPLYTALAAALFTLSCLGLGACDGALGSDALTSAEEIIDGLGGRRALSKGDGDDRGFAVDAEAGGSYRFSLARKAKGAEVGPAHARVLRFSVPAGQTFAAVLRRLDGSRVEAYLALFAEGQRVATAQYGQGLLPMAGEDDEVVIYRAAEGGAFQLFAADQDFLADATVQVDLIPLSRAVGIDASVTNPAIRAWAAELRRYESELAPHFASGALREGEAGLLEADLTKVESLKERARLNGLLRALNEDRAALYAAFVEATLDGERNLALQTSVGNLCGELWTALRSAEHTLDAR